MPTLEIAICTLNRVDQLDRAIDSIAAASVPANWQRNFIVVNNGSTDGTKDYLANLQLKETKLQVIDEPMPGLTVSRNRAVDSASGDLLVWTDDDVMVDQNWLAAYVDAFENQPDVSFWGGPIDPLFPHDAPAWVHENRISLAGCFAERDLGQEPFGLTPDRLPYGANFGLRTAVQKLFPFDPKKGRIGTELGGGDETELMNQLLSENYQGRWLPTAKVKHAIAPERLDESWIRSYFVEQGRELVRNSNPWSRKRWWLSAQSSYHQLQYRRLRNSSNSAAWLGHLIRSGLAAGQALELNSD